MLMIEGYSFRDECDASIRTACSTRHFDPACQGLHLDLCDVANANPKNNWYQLYPDPRTVYLETSFEIPNEYAT